MIRFTSTTLALAVAATASQAFASAQSESAGFIEDSSFELVNRNYYWNADLRDSAADEQSYGEEWAHGIIGVYQSGYTQGVVGFGVDAIGLVAIKLDSGAGRAGEKLLSIDNQGEPHDQFGQFGAAVKARFSNTEVKFGSQLLELPIFTVGGDLLPEMAQGWTLSSAEIDGLTVNAGHISALSSFAQSDHDSAGLEAADFIGGTYEFTENLAASLYYSDVNDAFDKVYANFTYVIPVGEERSLAFDFNVYDTHYDREYTGTGDSENNLIWSLATAYTLDAHTFTLGYQRSSGGYIDEEGTPIGYDFGIDGDGTVWLANSVQYNDFTYKDEHSWMLGYDLDMTAYGVPGLTLGARYVYADNIDIGNGEAKERELDFAAQYVFQDGPAKDLSLALQQAFYRADSDLANDVNELRLIVEYPLEVL